MSGPCRNGLQASRLLTSPAILLTTSSTISFFKSSISSADKACRGRSERTGLIKPTAYFVCTCQRSPEDPPPSLLPSWQTSWEVEVEQQGLPAQAWVCARPDVELRDPVLAKPAALAVPAIMQIQEHAQQAGRSRCMRTSSSSSAFATTTSRGTFRLEKKPNIANRVQVHTRQVCAPERANPAKVWGRYRPSVGPSGVALLPAPSLPCDACTATLAAWHGGAWC